MDEKEKINIVIIEDEDAQKEMYSDTIDEYNREDPKYLIDAIYMSDDKNLPKYLYESKCDCIVIDLKWDGVNSDYGGNDLLERIINKKRIPTIVVSGNLSQLRMDINEFTFCDSYERSDDFQKVINKIVEYYETGYTRIVGESGRLDDLISKVFWNHLTNKKEDWDFLEQDIKEKRILRFALARINAQLEVDGENHDCFSSVEVYIKPPVRKKAFSGDIIKYQGKTYAILSVACDFENGNNDFIVMCYVEEEKYSELISNIKDAGGFQNLSNKKRDEIHKLIRNNLARFHLLPPCSNFTGGKIDFQNILSISKEDIESTAEIIATITPSVFKDIQARFSHYYGRQGQPALDSNEVEAFILYKD